jgi:hypothetical protein
MLLARNNPTNFTNELRLITVPAASPIPVPRQALIPPPAWSPLDLDWLDEIDPSAGSHDKSAGATDGELNALDRLMAAYDL